MTNPNHVTPKQINWFAKVREGLEKDTGVALEEWIEIARACPETSHRKRLSWFKTVHGIGINRASTILGAAFETGLGWDNPEALINELWKKPELRIIYDAIEACATSLDWTIHETPDSFTRPFFCSGFCEGAEYGLYFRLSRIRYRKRGCGRIWWLHE